MKDLTDKNICFILNYFKVGSHFINIICRVESFCTENRDINPAKISFVI